MKFLIFVCMQNCGGLGDRLKGVTEAFHVASQTNRSFAVHPKVFEGMLKIKEVYQTLPQCGNSETHEIMIDRADHHRLVQRSLSPQKCLYMSVNLLTKEPADKLDVILATIFHPARYRPFEHDYTAVHIRTGGNGDFKGIDPPRYKTDDVARFFSRVDPSKRVFLATDSKDVKQQARAKMATILTQNNLAVHIDRSPVSKDSDLSAVAKDFEALVNANCLVFGRSGFSEMALHFPGHSQNLSCSCKIPLNREETAICGEELARLNKWQD